MLRYTCTTWNPYQQYHSLLYSLDLIFVKLVENDFRDLHLHNLKSLLAILLCTTLAQPESHHSHKKWEEMEMEIRFLWLWSHYIRTTWFQRFSLAQHKIFIFMVKWHFMLNSHTLLIFIKMTYFALHSHTLIFIKGTLMQIWKSTRSLSLHKNKKSKVSHYNRI